MGTIEYTEDERYQAAGGGVVTKAKKADTLVYYSTSEGDVAVANSSVGSYFTMALYKIMVEYFVEGGTSKYSLNDVITKVNHFVSKYIEVYEDDVYVQMCEARFHAHTGYLLPPQNLTINTPFS